MGASALGYGLAGCGGSGDPPPGDGRPDIVLLVLDSLRAKSLPFHGHPWDTAPFLTGLAAQSTVFKRCYAAATWTRPSVTSILTGLPPLGHRGWRFNRAFPADQPNLARYLAKAGYRTGSFTENPAIGEGYGIAEHFDHVANQAAKESDFGPRLTKDCMSWVRSLDGPEPAFVYTHYWPPHGPYKAPNRFQKMARSWLPQGTAQIAHHNRGGAAISLAAGVLGRIPWYQAKVRLGTDLADYERRYAANIAYADSLVADFFSNWSKHRRNRRTVFLVTSDHGEGLGEHGLMCDHGMLLIDEILHVPLILHDTAANGPDTVTQPVSHLDLGPTILELAGSSDRIGMMNESLLGDGPPERAVIGQEGLEGPESGWALTSGRWRLVYNGGARFGNGHVMEVRSAEPSSPTMAGTPLPVRANALRRPIEIADGLSLDVLVLHNRQATPGSTIRFSGTLRVQDGVDRMALRVRTAEAQPVSLGAFTDGDFEGEVAVPDGNESGHLIVEGAHWARNEDQPPETGWVRVLTVPVTKPQRLSEALEILAVTADPPVACAGDAVRITFRWRAHQPVGKKTGVVVELIDPQDRVAISEARTFFRRVPEEGTEPRPLVEPWDLEKQTFSEGSFDFDDSFWWTVPASSVQGIHSVRVGLVDYGKLFWGQKVVTTADPVPMTTVEVGGSRSESLQIHHRRELGSESLRLPPSYQWKPTDHSAIEALAQRFPDEGHFQFLLSRDARTDSERRKLLQSCLRNTPFHSSALADLADLGEPDAAAQFARLTPRHPGRTGFGDQVSVTGFDLCRGESCVYLTLFWEAEAVSAHTFSGKLNAKLVGGSGEPSERWLWWFLGGEQRPTHVWKIGETVIETLRIKIEPETEQVSIKLQVAERWQKLYSRNRGLFVVTEGNDRERTVVTADLGAHRLEEIPPCTADFLALKRSDPAQYVLVDLDEDPLQKRNLVHTNPEVFSRMQRHLESLLIASDSWNPQQEASEVELSQETVEQLRALGYLD
jgi:arylsulfatase A-like enzyme